MDQLERLQMCLQIARKHNNKAMERNILQAIKDYKQRFN